MKNYQFRSKLTVWVIQFIFGFLFIAAFFGILFKDVWSLSLLPGGIAKFLVTGLGFRGSLVHKKRLSFLAQATDKYFSGPVQGHRSFSYMDFPSEVPAFIISIPYAIILGFFPKK